MKHVLLALFAALCLSHPSFAQIELPQKKDALTQARELYAAKDYEKAVPLYADAYRLAPGDADIYSDYFNALLATKAYKDAEKLIDAQQRYRNSPILTIDYGRLLAAQGKQKKAEEMWDGVIQAINGDDIQTQLIAAAFIAAGRDDYALKTYERGRDLLHNSYVYSGPLARLYAKTGATDKAVDAILDGNNGMPNSAEDAKATMLELLGNDPKRLQTAQKALIRRINAQPESNYYSDLLTWLYSQKGDWDGALLQIQAIDERNKEGGQRLLEFARTAEAQGQHETANKALDAVIEKGAESPFYATALGQKLSNGFEQMSSNPAFSKEDVAKLDKEYAEYLSRFPQAYSTQALLDYATLKAQYGGDVKGGIALLQQAITTNNASRDFIGRAKLQLGDYQVVEGSVWDATLTYSQVDKAFKEDVLGEEARFRNAKLSYYRGDFVMAQGQLSVLKASTSELIANDALYLSVLITENTPDSNFAPLLSFAKADLLLFQNKDAAAQDTLNALTKRYPENPLQDDILMLRANLSVKHRDYPSALGYLKTIIDKYGKDVLADDAEFKTAEIYEKYLKLPAEAKKWYENLIIDYPGSTWVQIARQRLAGMNGTGSAAPM